jgi:hypothetical protein
MSSSSHSSFFGDIRAFIAEDRLEEAFARLTQANLDPQDQHTLTMLENRYHRWQRDLQRGTVSNTETDPVRNQISSALLDIVNRGSASTASELPNHTGMGLMEKKRTKSGIIALQAISWFLLVLTCSLLYTYLAFSEPWDPYRTLISLGAQIAIGLGSVLGVLLLILWGSKEQVQNNLIAWARRLAVQPVILLVGVLVMGAVSGILAAQLLGTTQVELYADQRMDLYLVEKGQDIRLGELPKEQSQKYRLPVGMNHLFGLSKPAEDTLFEDQKVYVDLWGKESPIQIVGNSPKLKPESEPEVVQKENQPLPKSGPKNASPPAEQSPTFHVDQESGDGGQNIVAGGNVTISMPAANLSPPPPKDTTSIDSSKYE